MATEKNDKFLILEIRHLDGPAAGHIQKFRNFPIRIGRGFHNDLILSDPFVCARHLLIHDCGDKGWVLEDLKTINGVFINKKSRTGRSTQIKSGDVILLGKTRLRIYENSHPVHDAQKMDQSGNFLNRFSGRLLSTAIFASALGVMTGINYLETWSGEKITIILAALTLILWSVLWGIAGKIARHRARFHSHLAVTGLFVLASLFTGYFADYAEYVFNENIYVRVFDFALFLALFFWLISAHLSLASPMGKKRRLQTSGCVSLGLALGLCAMGWLQAEEFDQQPDYAWHLMPYMAEFSSRKTPDIFLGKMEKLFVFEE